MTTRLIDEDTARWILLHVGTSMHIHQLSFRMTFQYRVLGSVPVWMNRTLSSRSQRKTPRIGWQDMMRSCIASKLLPETLLHASSATKAVLRWMTPYLCSAHICNYRCGSSCIHFRSATNTDCVHSQNVSWSKYVYRVYGLTDITVMIKLHEAQPSLRSWQLIT